jgi:two-component system sensor histidine kinase HydH
MKILVHTSSYIVGLLCWVLGSALTLFILGTMRDRARLIRDNDNERILNGIVTELRGHEDFGSAIESSPVLSERIAGFAIYGEDLSLQYRWGDAPDVFNEGIIGDQKTNKFNRYTIQNKKGDRVKFVLHHERPSPPFGGPMQTAPPRKNPNRVAQENFVNAFNILAAGNYIYIDITHPAYWRVQTLTEVLFPVCEAALLAAVFYIRRLYLRNREYRERIEAQKNLVVLGAAASTLAHEIKNPLLSIRLQTGILKKLLPDTGQEEVAIIDEEVERLSELTYRVNDYLREAQGNKAPLPVYPMIAETAQRLCGRNIVRKNVLGEAAVFMDPYRARSVFENVLRNALESGGDEAEVGVSITRNNGFISIEVFDRGKGISDADMKRVFDPFFTRKSAGTGIGLSISKRFVEAVDGSIVLERREGGGTVARINIPEWVSVPDHQAERGAG